MAMSESPLIYHLTFYLTHLHIHQGSPNYLQGRQKLRWVLRRGRSLQYSQVDKAIDIFEGLTQGWAQGLFLFDNAPSHQKRALDAISA